MNINSYKAIAQYQQLIFDLLKEQRFYSYNDISITGNVTNDLFPFGVVCFREENNILYAFYTVLHQNIENTAGHHVTLVCVEVDTGYKSVVYSANVHDLDDMFTAMYNIENRVSLLLVNEPEDSITYKFPNLVTFIGDTGNLYDKALKDCNYAIVRD